MTRSEEKKSRQSRSNCGEQGVRLAQKMQVGPRIPGEYSYKGLKLAQLLGQLGVFLTLGFGRIVASEMEAPTRLVDLV